MIQLKFKTLITALSIALLATACDNGKKIERPDGSSSESYDPLNNGLMIIDPRPPVSAFQLDEFQFHVGGVRVGLQDYMQSESPAISFFRPELADYVEILRCSKDTIIQSGVYTLKDVELGASQIEELTQILRANDFWTVAEQTNGCTLVASDYSDRELFIDGAAPSGGYRWIVRACVHATRLMTAGLTTRACTKQISVSPVLENFKNKRIESERLAMEQARMEQNKMDSLGRAIYYKTVEYNNALARCQEREDERAANVVRKRAIANIVGQGIGIGATIYAAGSAISSAGASAGATAAESSVAVESAATETVIANSSSNIGMANSASNRLGTAAGNTVANTATTNTANIGGSFSYSAAAQAAWNTAGTTGIGTLGGGLGTSITSAINDLFSSSSDIPRSCAQAQKIRNEGSIITNQLKSAHQLFAIKMDQATIVRKNRVSLEAP
ncbi:MAG: hypothetical protein R3B45_08610 [Bdellovibrionota bacterium]